ncbi:retropepsin-like aspartic protease, partial [Sphingomonas sp. RB1R13]|uniref:retropepsin-like aspartic protease n=1 Tax=Sphingomonas sp. RB1R13 TaxID=3096159 RepID=UPI002FC783B5
MASIDPEAQNKWIDMEGDDDGLVIIPIVLNGHRLMAVLDTGAPETTLDARWATRHGMKYQPYGHVTAMAGKSVQTGIAPVETLQIGGFHQAGGA